MKKHSLIIISCLLAHGAYAQEEPKRIPDLSMSPEESFQDLNNSRPPGNAGSGYSGYNNYIPQNAARGMNPSVQNDLYSNGPSGHFMSGYCDPDFKPVIANAPGLSGLQSCLEEQKQQVCEAFQTLPADAARALDDTIGCIYVTSENDPSNAQPANDPACVTNDSLRLRLVKKYWRDEHIAHALVFMPDEVLNASGKCIRGGK